MTNQWLVITSMTGDWCSISKLTARDEGMAFSSPLKIPAFNTCESIEAAWHYPCVATCAATQLKSQGDNNPARVISGCRLALGCKVARNDIGFFADAFDGFSRKLRIQIGELACFARIIAHRPAPEIHARADGL